MKRATLKTTTAEALLGMLSMRPMSGYDLKLQIELTIGNFWSESFGQIYPTLKRLQSQGLVGGASEGKAGRKVYTITDAGREHLELWLRVPPKPRVARNELLLKLFFGRLAPVESMRAHVVTTRMRYAADLARYESYRPRVAARFAGSPNLAFVQLPLSFGSAQARMIMAWCDETLTVLDGVEDARLGFVAVKTVLPDGPTARGAVTL